MQEVDLLQDDGDSPEAHGSAVLAKPLEAAARTALLRQLPPDSRPAAQAAFAAAGGADVDAVQTAFEVRTFFFDPAYVQDLRFRRTGQPAPRPTRYRMAVTRAHLASIAKAWPAVSSHGNPSTCADHLHYRRKLADALVNVRQPLYRVHD